MTVQTNLKAARLVPRRHETITFTQVVTPLEADHMLNTMRYDHQRPLRASKVQSYAEEMRNGTFRELTQLFIVIYGGRHVLVDGQHRLNAVIQSDMPYLFTIVEKEVESAEEIARLYSTTDIGARRTPSDIYGAYDLQNEFGFSKSMIDRFGGAIKFMASGCLRTGSQIRHDAVISLMRIYAPYMRTYTHIIESNNLGRQIYIASRRSSTIAAALLTLRFSAPKAERERRPSVAAFWTAALLDDGLKIGDPQKAAYRHLAETRIQPTHAPQGAAITQPPYSVRYLGSCLNAYIKGESLKYAKVFNPEGPVNIYGVPSDPTQWW